MWDKLIKPQPEDSGNISKHCKLKRSLTEVSPETLLKDFLSVGQSTWHDQAVGVSRHARVSYVRNDIPDYLATQNGDFREDNISKQKLLKELNTMCWD